jgi:hypothetical protein
MTPKTELASYRFIAAVMDQSIGGQLGWMPPKEAVPLA